MSDVAHGVQLRLADGAIVHRESIEALGLSVRAHNALWDAGLRTISQVIEKSEPELLKIRNLGRGSLANIRSRIRERGESLAGEAGLSAERVKNLRYRLEALVREASSVLESIRQMGL